MLAKAATLWELREKYYLEDVYDLLEILDIDAHNRHVIAKAVKAHRS